MSRTRTRHAIAEPSSVPGGDGDRECHGSRPTAVPDAAQISRLIAALEEEVGFKLFLRHRRRLVPTQEGNLFYNEAKRILTGLDEISRVADDIRSHKEARLRIVSQPYLGLAVIATFSQSRPNLRVSVEIRSRGDVASWVAGHQFDLGIVPLPIDVPGVRSEPFAGVRSVPHRDVPEHMQRRQLPGGSDRSSSVSVIYFPTGVPRYHALLSYGRPALPPSLS